MKCIEKQEYEVWKYTREKFEKQEFPSWLRKAVDKDGQLNAKGLEYIRLYYTGGFKSAFEGNYIVNRNYRTGELMVYTEKDFEEKYKIISD